MKKITEIRTMAMVAFGALSFLVSGRAFAQDSIRIDLQQALEIALNDNPTVKVAENSIELKKFTKYENIGSLLPNISANGSFQHSLKQQKVKVDFAPEPIAFGQPTSTSASFNLSLPLIAPQLWKTIQLSQEDIKLAMETARSSKIDMINQVKNAYYGLLLAEDSYQAFLAGYKNAELNAKNVTDKYNVGLVSEYDKLASDVQFRNLKPQLVNSENAVKLARLQLLVLMGIDVHTPVIFEGNLQDYEKEMYADLMSLKNDTALTDNSLLKQFDIQEQQLKLAKKINLLGYAPTLAMSLNGGWSGMGKNLDFKHYYWAPNSSLGLSLNIPIFTGGQKYYKNKQNKVSLINLDLQRYNVKQQLEVSVQNALNNIETSVEQMASNKESIIQAEKAFTISQKRYDVGAGTVLEMNSSETALTQARLQYAQAIYNYLSSRANLEATLGREIQTTQK
ncbi:MAG: TolC family protein [Bacteroidales bacterium]